MFVFPMYLLIASPWPLNVTSQDALALVDKFLIIRLNSDVIRSNPSLDFDTTELKSSDIDSFCPSLVVYVHSTEYLLMYAPGL